jgi:uncharacterized damage-inducible protein DinB
MNGTIKGWQELFRYDRWAMERVVEVLERNRPSGMDLGVKSEPLVRAGRLIAHLATAQRVWLSRVKGDGEEPAVLWPVWPRVGGLRLVRDASDAWLDFLERLPQAELDREVHYRNTRGIPFTIRLDRILQHVVNHGTHHRGQVLEAFRHLDIPRPVLDFIAFDREVESLQAPAEQAPEAG